MKQASLLLFTFASFVAFAQKPTKSVPATPAASKTDTASIIKHYEAMYAAALQNNDFQVATNAMYSILTYRPNDVGIKDTLARLYFTRSMSVQAVLVGIQVLEVQPENQQIIEVVAASQESLGMAKEALESYEKLYSLNKANYYLYQVASLQYRLKRMGECKGNLDLLLASKGVDTDKITMTYGQQGSQEVIMKAAVLNMLGVMALDLGQTDSAKQLFNESVKVDPEFVLAKANIEQMAKTAAGDKAPGK